MPSDLRALLLTREYPPDVYGGAGVHVDYLSRELAKQIAVEVRTFGDQESQAGNLVVQGFGSAQASIPETPEKLVMALAALRVCLGFAARPITADVVHCHTWYAHFGGVLAKILYGIPLVVTAHSLEPLRPWKRDQLGRGVDLSAWVERTAIEMADAVVAVSQEMRADILRLFAVRPERVHVIHNGIDTEEYRRTPSRQRLDRYGIDRGRPYVLFVGRISKQKGILHLLRSVPHLAPQTQLVLCASSPDSEDTAREVEAAVATIQARRDGVIWIREMVDRPTAIQLYSHAAVFCCPSIYEPFGIINLEAMACETPVVASAVGGIREVVVHEKTGFLVPLVRHAEAPFEPVELDDFSRDLARSVNALVADPALRRSMGLEGRRRAETLFSWGAIARQTVTLYQSLCSVSPPTAGRRLSSSDAR
jgi:alpha-maltose-1-phosphate synthase